MWVGFGGAGGGEGYGGLGVVAWGMEKWRDGPGPIAPTA
jgi:hypothetical protein